MTIKLNDIAKIERGRFSPRPRNNPRYYGGDIPFVQTGDVSRAGIYIQQYRQTLNEEGLAVSKLFPKNTILMAIAANVGDVAILDFDSACPDSLVAFTPKEGISNKWLFHALSTMKNKFVSLSTQNAQKNLSLDKIKPVKIQVPSLEFQEVIASTLDVWDTAIEKTERLIAAKELQFGWLKLKLFDEASRKEQLVPLCELVKFTDGYPFLSSGYSENGIYNILTIANVQYGSMAHSFKGKLSQIPEKVKKEQRLELGDVLISMTGNVGRVCKVDTPNCLLNQRVGKLQANKNTDPDFLYFSLFNQKFLKNMIARAQGGAQGNLSKKDILKYQLMLPPLEEQKRIANTLNTARQEITLLKKLVDHYRMQKRGLMQKLLSGAWQMKHKETI